MKFFKIKNFNLIKNDKMKNSFFQSTEKINFDLVNLDKNFLENQTHMS